jgi:hypothetical protein
LNTNCSSPGAGKRGAIANASLPLHVGARW